MAVVNDSLLAFIKDQQKLGLDRDAITSRLAGQGWSADDIDEAFQTALASSMFPPQAGTKIASASSQPASPATFGTSPHQNNAPYQKPKHHGFMAALILIVVIFFGASAAYGYSTGHFANGLQSFSELFTPSSPPASYDISDSGTGDDTNGGIADSADISSGSGNPLAVPSISIDATPGTVTPGYSTSINWETQNASSCSLTNIAGQQLADQIDGSYVVSPSISSQYTLTCTGSAGVRTGQVTVYVGSSGEPSYSGSEVQPSYGTYTTTYSTTNGSVSSSGSGNSSVNTGSQSATVPPVTVVTTQTYVPPQYVPILSPGVLPLPSLSPSPTPAGSPAPSQGATSAFTQGAPQGATQSPTPTPSGVSSQTLAKTPSSTPGPISSPAPSPVASPASQVTPVNPANTPAPSPAIPVLPTVTLSANANPIAYGFAPFLTWTDANAASCSISPFNFSNSAATPTVSATWNNGNLGVIQTGPVTYTMTCTNAAGSASAKLTVNVNPIPSGANSPIANDQAAILGLIGGKTASALNLSNLDTIFVSGGNQEIFSTPQASYTYPIGTPFPRNSSLFSGSTDLSFLPVNYNNNPDFNGVLVAPDIMITANHLIGINGVGATPNPSWEIYFETNAGVSVSRHVIAGMQIPNTDIYVMRLDSPVAGPGTGIAFADVFSTSDFNKWIAPYLSANNFLPVMVTDHENVLGIRNLGALTTGEPALSLSNEQALQYVSSSPTVPGTFDWSIYPVGGDSGSAEFMLINGTPVALSTWTTPNTGANIAGYYDQINAAMTTLGSAYQLTPINLSGF